jgi:trigger factor
MAAYEIIDREEGKRTVRFESPAEDVDRAFRKVRREIARDLDMPGFRPGKVPRSIIDKRFGNVITSEVAERLSSELTEMVLHEEDWILGDGRPSADGALPAEGEDYSFTVTYEVFETPKPEGYRELELVEPAFDIDSEVEKSLDSLRQRMVGFEPVDRKAAEDDMVRLRAADQEPKEPSGEESEEEDGKGEISIRIGQSQAGPGFDGLVSGLSSGDRFTACMVPTDESAEWKGDPHTFEVLEVLEPVLPDLDDDLAVKLGAKSLEDLQGRIRSDLEERMEEDRRRFLEQQAIAALLKANEFQPPRYMVENLTHDFLGRLSESDPDEETVESARKVATDKVREFLLLRAVAEEEGIQVSREELAEQKSDEEDEGSVLDRIRNRKALELLVESATIKKKAPEEGAGQPAENGQGARQPWTWALAEAVDEPSREEGE